jgi:thymidine phosphorylase
VGRGIGPAEEARDVLAVLQGNANAPQDLRQRALFLAAHLFSLAYQERYEHGLERATAILDSGKAWEQFQHILAAQGGMKTLPEARYRHTETTPISGTLIAIDNRQLARLGKLSGAPGSPAAGLRLHVQVGDILVKGDLLFTLYSDSRGERDYALAFYREQATLFTFSQH